MDAIRQWHDDLMAEEAAKNLTKHGFSVLRVSGRREACEELIKRIPPSKTVGVGGSVTLRELGILDRLRAQGNVLLDHWQEGLTQEDSLKIRRAQQSCDLFLTSSNAVTLKGELVNVDGFCNRIAAMAFGPREVIFCVGRNKLVADLSAAFARIKEIVAPMNAKRFGAKTPCVNTGRCMDCDSPERICRGTLILERRPMGTDMLVMLIGEDLGF